MSSVCNLQLSDAQQAEALSYAPEPPLIQAGSRPIERLSFIEEAGVEYQCVQKCYPIVKPIPPPPPPPVKPILPTRPPLLLPPIIRTVPTKLPRLVPLTTCQFVCYRYPYSAECAQCKPTPPLPPPPPIRLVRPIPRPPMQVMAQKAPVTPAPAPLPPPTPPPPPPAPIVVQPPPVVIYNQMRCCYMDRCFVFPIQPVCPTLCYEPCNAICTGRCLPNPTCPNKCVEVGVKLKEYKIKFMIWLKIKLDQIKLRHRQMLEECILRTRANYVSEIRALQAQLIKSHPYLYAEQNSQSMRRGAHKGIYINILGQQNFGGKGSKSGSTGEPSSYHVNQNIGINNNDSPPSGSAEADGTSASNDSSNNNDNETPPEST